MNGSAGVKLRIALAGLLMVGSAWVGAEGPVEVPAGTFVHPVLLDREVQTEWVDAFRVDPHPVNRAAYAEFVERYPQWRRSAVADLFHDGHYLRHWHSDLTPNGEGDEPVVQVPWFAARAYCEARGGALPTLVQWEYLVHLLRTNSNMSDQGYANAVFAWYGEQRSVHYEDPVHGLTGFIGPVNEWLEDYQLLLSNGEKIDLGGGSCGDTGRLMARYDSAHYATLLRYQSRSNYTPETTASNQGFRCAYPIEGNNP